MFRGLVFIGILQFLSFTCWGKDITVMFYVDNSPSMFKKRQKLATLVPKIDAALKNSCGDSRISVNNILYRDLPMGDMRPIGTPAFINKTTPDTLLEIQNRILNPGIYATDPNSLDRDGDSAGRNEVTYSTVSRSLAANISDLADQDFVGIFILSDAIPTFEFGTPQEEIANISKVLGTIPFLAGALGGFMETDAKENGFVELAEDCSADNATKKGFDTSEWMTPNLLGLQEFTEISGGFTWNICEKDFDSSISQFINRLLIAAECAAFI